MTEPMLRVLGPTVVEAEGERRPVRGLAGHVACILASRYPQAVPSDVLAEALWPNRPPKESRTGLRVALHRLRQLLGDTEAVINENDGYRLALAPEEIDQVRFEAAADSTATCSASADELGVALDLWSGHAYEPFEDEELLRAASDRLAALRLNVEERHADALLSESRLDQAAMRASILVDEQPYRERRWELLMLALYRSGRQREALDVASRARTRLRDDLGIEPGPALRTLESDMLQQAAHLVAPSAETAAAGVASVGLGDLVHGLRELRAEVPRSAGAFFGRTDELDRIEQLLGERSCVTVVGPAGAGKTRLAARVCADRVARRVVWVDLVGATVDSLVARLVGALGIASGGDPAREIATELSHEPALLVLDNAEHIIDAVGDVVGALLEACEALAVLITSRHRLGRVFETPIDLGPLDALSATELLAQRVFGGLDAFDPRRADLAYAAEELGRLPLHLELLAPLLREQPIDEALAIVTNAPAEDSGDASRHATLASAIDWSIRTLSGPAVELHAVLGSFRGWFEPDDVVGVTGWEVDRVTEALTELVRHSLVSAELGGRVPMYRQLVGVGEHARAQLETSGQLGQWEHAHAMHFRTLARDLGAALEGPDEEAAVHRLERALPQIELARQRFLHAGDTRGVADISLGVSGSLLLRLDHEHYGWLDHVAELGGIESLDDAAELLSWAALVSWASADADRTRALLRRIEYLVGDDEYLPVPYFVARVNTLAYEGSLDERTQSFIDLWMASEERGTTRERATVASMMTLGYVQLGQLDAAATTARRAMRFAREVGNPSSIAWAEFAIGWSRLLDDPTAAIRSFLSVVRITRTVRSRWLEGLAIAAIATAALRDGRNRDVCRLLPEVLRHLGHNRAWPQLARSAREGVIALDAIGREDLAGQLLGHVSLLSPVHPLLDDDQTRFDEIAERLVSDGYVDVVDAASVDPARSWVEMASILESEQSASSDE